MRSLLGLPKKITYMSLSLLMLGLVACSPATLAAPNVAATEMSAAQATVVSQGQQVGDYTQFVNALRGAGATVTQGGQIQLPASSVNGQIVQVNGANVQVFEFASQAMRRQVSDIIARSGTVIDVPLPYVAGQADVWASGRLIVLYAGQDQSVMNLLSEVLGQPITQVQPSAIQLPANITQDIQKFLSQVLGLAAQQVQVVSAQQVNWPDRCLGLDQPGQTCAQVTTPGYRVVIKVNGHEYEIRTNQTATNIRWHEMGSGTTYQGASLSLGLATTSQI